MTVQIIVAITIILLGILERLFKMARSKNKLTNIIIKKTERNT